MLISQVMPMMLRRWAKPGPADAHDAGALG